MLKKTVSVIAIMSVMLSVFFYVPVHAATGYPTTDVNVYKYQIVNNCFIQVSGHTLNDNIDSWTDAGDNVGYKYGHVKHVFNISITNIGTSNIVVKDLVFTPVLTIDNNVQPSTDYYREITNEEYFGNDFIMNYARTAGYILLSPVSDWSSQGYICITPNTTLSATYFFETAARWYTIAGNIYYARLTDITFGSPTVTTTTAVPNGANSVINNSINYNGSTLHSDLIDIYGALSGNASTNNSITQDSNTLHNQSDSVHTQEASYYAANSQAIQATGLSNYQFDASAVSGLTGVRGDFIDIWNSLGSWNTVYIFSLTLGLALTILRHTPSAVSSALRRRKDKQ